MYPLPFGTVGKNVLLADPQIGIGIGIEIGIERQMAMASDCKRARGGIHPNGNRAARRVDTDSDTDPDSEMLRRGNANNSVQRMANGHPLTSALRGPMQCKQY